MSNTIHMEFCWWVNFCVATFQRSLLDKNISLIYKVVSYNDKMVKLNWLYNLEGLLYF